MAALVGWFAAGLGATALWATARATLNRNHTLAREVRQHGAPTGPTLDGLPHHDATELANLHTTANLPPNMQRSTQ